MLCWVAAFCQPLWPVLPLVLFPRSRSPVVGICYPHTFVLKPSTTCLAAFLRARGLGAVLLHALSRSSTMYPPPLRGSCVCRACSLLVADIACIRALVVAHEVQGPLSVDKHRRRAAGAPRLAFRVPDPIVTPPPPRLGMAVPSHPRGNLPQVTLPSPPPISRQETHHTKQERTRGHVNHKLTRKLQGCMSGLLSNTSNRLSVPLFLK